MKLSLTLKINGEDKTFTAPFVSGRAYRKIIELEEKELSGELKGLELLDAQVDYMVELYNGQFTADEYYDGIPGDKVVSTILEHRNAIIRASNKALGLDPDPKLEAEEKNPPKS